MPFLISRNFIFGNDRESWHTVECFIALNVCTHHLELVGTVLFCIHLVIKRQFQICINLSLLLKGRSKSSFTAIPIDNVLGSKTYLSICFIFKRSLIITIKTTWILFMLLFKRHKRSHMSLSDDFMMKYFEFYRLNRNASVKISVNLMPKLS